MVIMNDVDYRVGQYIVDNGFYKADILGKTNLIKDGMKKYMIDKVAELSNRTIPEEKQDSLSLHDLAEVLGEIIPEEEHENTMCHLTHYLLGITGFLQGRYITWFVEDAQTLIEEPIIVYEEDGKVDKLITHKQTPYVKTFDLALANFDTTMQKKYQTEKVYKKYLKTISQTTCNN